MLIDQVHEKYVHSRRVRVLSRYLCELVPENSSVVDIGCGDGLLASLILENRSDLRISGVDVLVRENTRIPVMPFDGQKLSLADKSIDVAMFVDVLHHTDDPTVLLREAVRVARKAIVIKDHTREGLLAGLTLRFMDHIGNDHHGVALPFNYWPKEKWIGTFAALKLQIKNWKSDLRLYPMPADWMFGRSLHFVARLDIA